MKGKLVVIRNSIHLRKGDCMLIDYRNNISPFSLLLTPLLTLVSGCEVNNNAHKVKRVKSFF